MPHMKQYIYTEKNDCQDCYRCIRECPVKAIRMEDQSAYVIADDCIYCGHCTITCPAGAKKVTEDVSTVRYLLRQNRPVIVSLAPSWVSDFPEYTVEQMITALRTLGFHGVSETALGAELMSASVREQLAVLPKGVWISPCCPSTIDLIKKYYPQHSANILPVDTPMLAHGKYIRSLYDDKVKVVFIGPCIAKKHEADLNPGIIDAAITFKKLREWFEEEEISPETLTPSPFTSFIPYASGSGNRFPVEGGMISCIGRTEVPVSFLAVSGVKKIMSVLAELDQVRSDRQVFIELMSCDGGCINGPGSSSNSSQAVRTIRVENNTGSGRNGNHTLKEGISLHNTYEGIEAISTPVFEEEEIAETLRSIGKQRRTDELNCGGCGYDSCREFALAVLGEKAEREMCVSYMRRVAQDKASALLQRMPYGVVLVDKKLRIVEANLNFAELAGDEALLAYDAKPGLEGADLRKLVPYHGYFENFNEGGTGGLEKDIRTDRHFLHLSIFPIQGKHLVCGIIHNLRAPELKREEIVKRTRKVIRENLMTVQKIAYYLGENASNMETLLNSIVDIQNEDEDE